VGTHPKHWVLQRKSTVSPASGVVEGVGGNCNFYLVANLRLKAQNVGAEIRQFGGI